MIIFFKSVFGENILRIGVFSLNLQSVMVVELQKSRMVAGACG